LDLPTPSLWLLTVLDSHKQLVCILILPHEWLEGEGSISVFANAQSMIYHLSANGQFWRVKVDIGQDLQHASSH
jgi:hypothetical protein